MKIDTTKIEGYAEMSAEDKLKALEGFDMPEPDYSGYIRKDIFDKTASELAEKKKELKSKMTEDEAAKAKADEEQKELEEKYNTLLHKVTVSENKAKLLSLGYEDKLADATAEAMAKGDLETVFANQKKHLETFEKNIRADALRKAPKPEGGGASETMTIDNLRKMSASERYKYSVDHPEEYKQLYGGTE